MAEKLNLYEAIGGKALCHRLSTVFYARVARDSVLRPLFPGKTFHCAIEELGAFLAQFLGGPSEDAQRRWWLSLRESHLRFKIGGKERDAWMRNMAAALDEVQLEAPVRGALLGFFERSSAYVVNTGQAPLVAEEGKKACPIQQEIARRWEGQRALDEAVAAIRGHDVERTIGLAESPLLQTCFNGNRAVFANLLALMMASGHSAMVDYVERNLRGDPTLGRERFGGRTLLHVASGEGNLRVVELLLDLGGDPNVKDGGGHAPLYAVGNECTAGGGSVVRALVQCGAHVDACDGVKHCTALHMAARRGNVEVAEALLECGADIEARDSLGDTPLRRAVNCAKAEVAALLLSRGADRLSRGSKGLTPVSAARAGAMSRLLSNTSRSAG